PRRADATCQSPARPPRAATAVPRRPDGRPAGLAPAGVRPTVAAPPWLRGRGAGGSGRRRPPPARARVAGGDRAPRAQAAAPRPADQWSPGGACVADRAPARGWPAHSGGPARPAPLASTL